MTKMVMSELRRNGTTGNRLVLKNRAVLCKQNASIITMVSLKGSQRGENNKSKEGGKVATGHECIGRSIDR